MMPDLAYWGRFFGLLALESTLIVAVTAGLARAVRGPFVRRGLWLGALAALGLGGAIQVAGLSAQTGSAPGAGPMRRVWMTVLNDPGQSAAPAAVSRAVRPGAERPSVPAPTWWPLGLWVAGAGVLLGRALAVQVRLSRHGRGLSAAPDEVLGCTGRLGARLGGVRAKVVVWPGLGAPMAWGVWRPTIAVPSDFLERFDEGQREVMLAHELAHLAHRDPLGKLLAEVIGAAFWWQPAVAWARRRFEGACEAAADTASRLVPGGPMTLAETLVALGRQKVWAGRPWMVGVAGSGPRSELGIRVRALLDSGQEWRRHGRFSGSMHGVAWTAVACLVGTLAMPGSGDPSLGRLLFDQGVAPGADQAALAESGQARAIDAGDGARDGAGRPAVAAEGAVSDGMDVDAPRAPESGSDAKTETVVMDVQVFELLEGAAKGVGFDWVFGPLPDVDPAPRVGRPSGDMPLAGSPDAGNVRVEHSETVMQVAKLTSAQVTALQARLEAMPGFERLGVPRVSTASGVQAQVQIADLRTLVTGVASQAADGTNSGGVVYRTEVTAFGPSVDLLPVHTNGVWNLTVWGGVTEFLGYDDPGVFMPAATSKAAGGEPLTAQLPLPRLRVRRAIGSADLVSGEALFVRGPVAEREVRTKGGWFRPAKTALERRRVYLLVQLREEF